MNILPKDFIAPFGDGSGRAIQLNFSGALGPHAAAVRGSYSVPKGSIALLSSSDLNLIGISSPTAVVGAHLHFLYSRDGENALELNHLELDSISANRPILSSLRHALILRFGDSLSIVTEDGNTGGIAQYNANTSIVEFPV